MDSSTYLPIVHVFEGRCPHRGALLADGRVEGATIAVLHAGELDEGRKALFAADGPSLLHVHTDPELV
jgi:hypothetical protein